MEPQEENTFFSSQEPYGALLIKNANANANDAHHVWPPSGCARPALTNKRDLHIYVLFEGLFSERAFPPPPPREQNHRTYICMSGGGGLF